MNSELPGTVLDRLDTTGPDDTLVDVVLGAIDGPDELAEAVDAAGPTTGRRPTAAPTSEQNQQVAAPRAFLRTLTEGFRGAGRRLLDAPGTRRRRRPGVRRTAGGCACLPRVDAADLPAP